MAMNTPIDPTQVQHVIDAIEELQQMMGARLLLVEAGVLMADEVVRAIEEAIEVIERAHVVGPFDEVLEWWRNLEPGGPEVTDQ